MGGLIAVNGSTGQLGGRIARLIAASGAHQRLLVREPARAPRLPGAQTEVVDLTGATGTRHQLAGVDTFVFVSLPESKYRARQQVSVIEAAAAAGVQRVVYVSFVGAAPDCTFTFGRDHWHTEQAIVGSGMEYVILRNNFYQDLLVHFAGPDGVIAGPAAQGRVAAVARDDSAAAIAAAALDESKTGQTYTLTGPEALTMAEVAALITEVTGTPTTYKAETFDEAYDSRAQYGAQAWEVEGWVSSYASIANGETALVTNDVETLTGKAPRSFREFLATQ
ncbi:MAG: SDR family oxidoreductase [Nocardiaceae bacterium]|nr:SDR family oxidoreductase [Nocardiaceae bacterium]